MAERNVEHNVGLEQKVLAADIADQKLGMWLGASMFGLLIVGAFAALFVTSNPIVPGLFLGTAAIGGVVAFIKGRSGG